MIKCNICKRYTTYSDVFGVAAMKSHVLRCEKGLATDTEQIPVLDVEPVCSRCDIRLAAVPHKPVSREDGTYHAVCAQLKDEEEAWVKQRGFSYAASDSATAPLRVPSA